MRFNDNEFLWSQKFRPQTIDECIIPAKLKRSFNEYITKGNIQHLLLTGGPGTGKTTVARAVVSELNCDLLFINASSDGNIDTLRNRVRTFCTQRSLKKGSGGKKVVILDEADGLEPKTQKALRAFMEELSKVATFILTANYANKIIDALHSRCKRFEFVVPASEKIHMLSSFMERCGDILDQESIVYDKKVLAKTIQSFYPDFRKTLNELQALSLGGTLSNDMQANLTNDDMQQVVSFVKKKQFTQMRKWVGEHSDIEPIKVMSVIKDNAAAFIEDSSIPVMLEIYNLYDVQLSQVSDAEINTVVFFANIMRECKFK